MSGPLRRLQRFFYKREIERIRRETADRVHRETDGVVQAGPLAGMALAREEAWGSQTTARLLGTFERELHGWVRRLAEEADYRTVVVAGCAEGYWAVGLALLFPDARIRAFEIDDRAREIARENARLNGVSERLSLRGRCTRRTLREAMGGSGREAPGPEGSEGSGRAGSEGGADGSGDGRALCFVDVEGEEAELLDPDAVPGLRASDLVVECHDRGDGSVRRRLADRFGDTHSVDFVRRAGRDPAAVERLRAYPDLEAWLALSEMRSRTSGWLVMRAAGPRSS